MDNELTDDYRAIVPKTPVSKGLSLKTHVSSKLFNCDELTENLDEVFHRYYIHKNYM